MLRQRDWPFNRRLMWQPISTAPYDRHLELAVIDHAGQHVMVFACRRTGTDAWIDVLTARRIDVQPTHWREWSEKASQDRLH